MRKLTYAKSGVNIAEADKLVGFLRLNNKSIGGFSGLFPLNVKGVRRPVLVASTDGVGTKLLVAKEAKKLEGLGIDLVAMVVNDLVVCGATPLFFLDYYATGKLDAKEAKIVLSGIWEGCKIAGCPLIGGETAELPGLYAKGDFDLAGFGVGIVDASEVIDGQKVKSGDLVYGFESTGLHSNGYSLARRVLLGSNRKTLLSRIGESGERLGEALLRPTRIYVPLARELKRKGAHIKAFAHITGGGIPGNLCRVLPAKVDAAVHKDCWEPGPLFDLIQERGPVDELEMFRTFNMGIGFMAIAGAQEEKKIEAACKRSGDKYRVVGEILKGTGKVRLVGGNYA